VSERRLNTETRGKLPRVRQHLVGALHARSPVTLRKKDRGAYAQVSAAKRGTLGHSGCHHHRAKRGYRCASALTADTAQGLDMASAMTASRAGALFCDLEYRPEGAQGAAMR